MPNYRVGVSLDLRGNYGRNLTGAASKTERFRGVVARTAGSATGDLRRTSAAAAGVGDAVGRTARRSTSGLQRVAGAAGTTAGALDRTAGATRRVGTASRRMADTASDALGRTRRRVNDLIGRYRVLERTSRNAGGGGLTGGIGRLAGAAGGIYGVSRVVSGEATLDQQYTDLAIKAGLSREGQADLQRRVEEAAEAAQIPRVKLLASAAKEYELSGDIAPILEDLNSTAKVLRTDPNTTGEALGAVRAQFKNFELDTPEARERAMYQGLQAAMSGALSFADLARSGGEAMSAQTEIYGNRSWEDFLLSSQQIMTGFMKAEPTMTAYAALLKIFSLEREALTKQIGQIEPGTSPIDVANRLVASVGGDIAALKGTPFGTQETLGALAGLVGQKGQALGAQVEPAINLSRDELWAGLEPAWRRQAETPAAALEVAQDISQRDLGGPLMTLWRPATMALVTHLPKIELGVAALVAAYGATKAVSWIRRGVEAFRGRGTPTPSTPGGGFGGGAASAVATMRVGTLIVGSMPGGGASKTTPGTILGPDGKPVPRGQGAPPKGSSGGPGVRPGRPGRLAGWSRALGRTGRGIPYVGAGIAALSLAPAVASGDTRRVVQSTAGLAGSLGFAKLGAAIGTAIAPGIGTAIGGLAGGLIGWFAGEQAAARLDPDTWRPRVDVELDENGRPTQSVRGRVRERGLLARTAGVEREPDEDDVDAEDVDGQPKRSVRGRVRQKELEARGAALELQPAQRTATYDQSDHSDRRVNIAPGAITVQAAEDPEATAEAVADRVMEITEQERGRRDRRLRDTALEDPDPDPVL